MRVNNIVTKESTLLESMMLGTDRGTRSALRNMQENFVVPYTKYLNSISRRLTEAELTPDQITQLFGSVTQGAQQAGGNETMLGKMMPDSIKKKFVDSLPAPDAGEVPGFEEKATAAVQQVQDPATKQSLLQVIKTGLQNPVTQKLIIAGVQGVVGIAAGALTGGLGGKLGATAAGAITGGLVGLIAAKLQGQDWKTAGKAGLKGAAIGGAGGLAGSLASGLAGSAIDAAKGNGAAQSVDDKMAAGVTDSPPKRGNSGWDSMKQTNPDGTPYTLDQVNATKDSQRAGNAYSVPAPTGGNEAAFEKEWATANTDQDAAQALAAGAPKPTIGQSFNAGIAPTGANGQPMQQVPMETPAASSSLGGQVSFIDLTNGNSGTMNLPDGTSVPVNLFPEGGIQPRLPPGSEKIETEVNGKPVTAWVHGGKAYVKNYKAEGTVRKGTPLAEYVDRDLTVRMWALHESLGKHRGGVHLTEAGIGNLVKDIGGWIKTKGQNLTQTVTADKLMQAWKKAGSPTDSEKVAELLTKQGVAPEVLDASYKSMSIPRTAPAEDPGKVEPTMDPAAPAGGAAPAASKPAGFGFNPHTGLAFTSAAERAAFDASPEASMSTADVIKAGASPAAGAPEAEPAATEPAAAEPAAGAPEAEPAAAEPAAPAGGGSIFADPKKLAASFASFQEADGSLPPAFRGVLKDILLTALRTVESKQRKLYAIIKESKHLQKQVAALKKRKQI